MEQFSATTAGADSTGAQDQPQPAPAGAPAERSGFASRGRIRRRARFLRKARELAYRDLGGLVFNLHRFGQRNDPLVLAKLNLLTQIDDELRRLETALGEHQPVTVLREAGITACARCAAIHGSEDRYCPNCGLSFGRHPDLPIAVAGTTAPATPVGPLPGSGPGPAPATGAHAPPGPGPAPATGTHAPPGPGAAPATGTHAPAGPGAPPAQPAPAHPPVTAQHAAAASPAATQTAPQAEPATQAFPALSDAAASGADGEDSITEIIRPPAQSP